MAGLYGHERANRTTSKEIYALSWARLVSDPRHTGRLAATGYSCRCQAALVDRAHLLHPIQILLARVKAGPYPANTEPPRAAVMPIEHREEY